MPSEFMNVVDLQLSVSTSTPPSTGGTSQSGLTSIGSGVDLIVVTFLAAFTSIPAHVIATVEKPSGGDNIFATVRRDTVSTTGFTAELSGTTPDANHKLSWLALR